MYLAQWLPWIGVAAAMLTVWTGTTYFWLRLAKVPGPAAFSASPALTTTVILILSIVYEKAGWFWSGARVLPALALIGGIGAAIYVLAPQRANPARGRYRMRFLTPSFALAAMVGWALAALPTILVAPPGNPPQQWDPSFHLNGVWGMTQLGIGAPGAGLAHNYGGSAPETYPIGWHSFTALFATGPTTVQTANASSLALMAVWVVGAAVYTYTLYPSRTAATAAAVIAGLMPSMPADALTAYSQWPNAMSVALLPGGATLMILLGRSVLSSAGVHTRKGLPGALRLIVSEVTGGRPLRGSWKHTGVLALLVVLTTIGGVVAHQVYAFNLVFLLIPAVAAGWLRTLWWSAKRSKWWLFVGTLVGGVLAILVFTWAEKRPELESLRSYPRRGVNVSTGLSQALIPNPPWGLSIGLIMFNTVFVVLLIAGFLRIIGSRIENRRSATNRAAHWPEHSRSARVGGPRITLWNQWSGWEDAPRPLLWPLWSYLIYATITFFAYGPDWAIRVWVVGPWFNDGRRIMEPASLALIPIMAVGFSLFAQWATGLWQVTVGRHNEAARRVIPTCLGGLFLVGSAFGAIDARVYAARSVLDATALGKSGMADQEMLELMRELPDLLPEDALVLGDPKAGAMYSQVIGQRWAYFPQLSLLNADRETQEVIVDRFANLAWDPEVCDAIRKAGITHYISAPDGAYYGVPRSDRMPGLYDVDTSVGFELVAEGGKARLYKITACETE